MALDPNTLKSISTHAGALVAGVSLALAPLMASEGLRTHAYLPTPNDRWTICYGETHDVQKGDVVTPAQCAAQFRERVAVVTAEMQTCLKVPVTPVTAQAMIRFGYNVGTAAYCKRVAASFNAGQPQAGCDWMRKYTYQKGAQLRGLVIRRAGEADECTKGLA